MIHHATGQHEQSSTHQGGPRHADSRAAVPREHPTHDASHQRPPGPPGHGGTQDNQEQGRLPIAEACTQPNEERHDNRHHAPSSVMVGRTAAKVTSPCQGGAAKTRGSRKRAATVRGRVERTASRRAGGARPRSRNCTQENRGSQRGKNKQKTTRGASPLNTHTRGLHRRPRAGKGGTENEITK